MFNDTFETYRKQQFAKKDLVPTTNEYNYFLGKAVEKLKIPIDEIVAQYGHYTYGQWKELLKLF